MFQFFKDLIDKDASPRVAAFLAVLAGVGIAILLILMGIAVVFSSKNLMGEFAAVLAAAVSLATFNKVDRA